MTTKNINSLTSKIISKYKENLPVIAQIEALRRSGKVNMFDVPNVLKKLTKTFIYHTEDDYTNVMKKYFLMQKGIPQDLQQSEYFDKLASLFKLCFDYNVPDLWRYYRDNSNSNEFTMYDGNNYILSLREVQVFKKNLSKFEKLEDCIMKMKTQRA